MINIQEYLYNNSSMLCESFKDPRIYQVWQSLTNTYHIRWNEIFSWKVPIAWDKLDKKDIEEIDNINEKDFNNVLKAARKIKAGKDERPFIIIGITRENVKCIYSPDNGAIYIFIYSNYRNKWTGEWRYQGEGITQSEQFIMLKNCDYLLKIYIDVNNISQLKLDRREAKKGSWELTTLDHNSKHLQQGVLGKNKGGFDERTMHDLLYSDSFYGNCERMVNAAVKKWKEIIADNKFARNQDTTEVDDAVKDILTRLPQATSNIMKNPDKYNRVYPAGNIEDLLKKVYNQTSYNRQYSLKGYNGLLINYQEYCECVLKLKDKNTNFNKTNALKDHDRLKEDILYLCKELDAELKKYDA